MVEVPLIQLARGTPIQRQLTTAMRELIQVGELPPGCRLPSSQALAKQWATDAMTVHRALAPLVKQGLLERAPGAGTFVRQPVAKLTCVGVYYREDFWARGTSLFIQSLHAQLKTQLNERGIETDVWIDPRPAHEEAAGPWAPFAAAARRREFQAVIAPAADHSLLRWLTRLPVPGAFLTSADVPGRVDADLAQMVELGLRALAQQGCRSAGLITSTTINPDRDAARHPYDLMFERFTDCARDGGLRIQNGWVRGAVRHLAGGAAQDAFGYHEFHHLWDQPDKPEGLLVFPDTTARGVILALTERGVRVPDDLRLVLHKNEEIDLLCPFPATFLVSSERETAQALITQVERQFRGESGATIYVTPALAQ